MASLSIRRTLRSSFVFSVRDIGKVLSRVLLPSILGGAMLYTLGIAYIAELDRFLAHHDERSASLVLALAGGGLLILLFLHAVVVTGVISLVLGKPRTHGWNWFHVALPEWRVYAGLLRLVVIAGILVTGGEGVRVLLLRLGVDPIFGYISQLLILLLLVWLTIRLGFFIGPVGVDRETGQLVGRAWEVSSLDFWRIAAIGVVCLIPGIAFYLLGEYCLRVTGLIAIPQSVRTLTDVAGVLHSMLITLVVLISITYLFCAIPLSAAAAFAYRDLVRAGAPER